ncbi:MAG: hypothetical protein GXP40_08025 [Chloroflexi bacterium]|nr:hypothetical protein [Chloroflexota bacterium]
MLFQATTPDTSAYMIAGYTVFFSVTFIYLISIFTRWRSLKQDLSLLEELEEEQK